MKLKSPIAHLLFVELALYNGNTSTVLRLNETTDVFKNLNFGSSWLAETSVFIPGLGPRIEFCYINN